MTGAFTNSRQRGRVATSIYVALGVLAGLMLVGFPHLPFSGTSLGVALTLALAAGPVLVALAIARPLVVPFAIWAALVPFDNILFIAGVGKIAKPLGALAAAVAILTILIRRRALRPSLATAAWGLVWLVALISLWWAQSHDFGALTLQQSVGLLLVGAVLSLLPCDRRDLRGLFYGVVGGGVAASLYAIVLFATTGHALFIGASQKPIDHNHFGAALLLPAMCATVAAIALNDVRQRWFAAAAAALIVAGIGVSESRGAMIAFGIGVVYLIVRSVHRWRLIPFAAIATIVLISIPGVIARFNDPTTNDAAGRYQIWHIGLAAFSHRWFAGYGYGMFMPAYQQAFLEFPQPAATAQRVQMPHNMLIEFAVELGIIGLAVILLAWWVQFRSLRCIQPEDGGWFEARLALDATTISLFVSTLSLDLLTFKYPWLAMSCTWIFWSAFRSVAPTRRAALARRVPLFGRLTPAVPAAAPSRPVSPDTPLAVK